MEVANHLVSSLHFEDDSNFHPSVIENALGLSFVILALSSFHVSKKIWWYFSNETCTVVHSPDCYGKDYSEVH